MSHKRRYWIILFLLALLSGFPQEEALARRYGKGPADANKKINPVPANEESLNKGKNIFNRECLVCHTVNKGKGDRFEGEGFESSNSKGDRELFTRIVEGLGDDMPSFKDSISEEERWHLINYIRTLAGNGGKPAAPLDINDTLKKLLPNAQEIKKEIKVLTKEQKNFVAKTSGVKLDPELDNEFIFYEGIAGGKVVGYAAEDRVRGKWGIIRYVAAFNPEGTIRDIVVLEHKEKRGKPVSEDRFLGQFKGKTTDDKIRLNRDIDGISGATVTSQAMTEGLKKMIHIFNVLYKE